MKDASNQSEIDRRKGQQEHSARMRQVTLKAILSHREGRDFFWWLLEQGNVHGETFSPDPYISAYAQGARSYGKKVLDEVLRTDANAYLIMIKENREIPVEKEDDDTN